MSGITRFDLHQTHSGSQTGDGVMRESKDGEYVAYDDHAKALTAATAETAQLRSERDAAMEPKQAMYPDDIRELVERVKGDMDGLHEGQREWLCKSITHHANHIMLENLNPKDDK